MAALDHVLERNMHRVSHNITLIQAQIAQEHRSEWATGVLVYGGCFVVFCVTMMIYMVCIYKGMKGKYDMNMALTGNPINELSFKNCFKGEAKRNSLEQPQNLLTKEALESRGRSLPASPDGSARRASLLLPGGFTGNSRRSSRSSRGSIAAAAGAGRVDSGSDSDESVIISMS